MNKDHTQDSGELDIRSLRVLEAIEKDPHVTQRDLARDLGTALGIANACVHALVKRGMVKIRGENKRSITYHLTKRGVLHKTKLAFEWTKNTIGSYKAIKDRFRDRLALVKDDGAKDIVIIGEEEIVEIGLIVAASVGFSSIKACIESLQAPEKIGSAEPDERSTLLGAKLVKLADVRSSAIDAIVICSGSSVEIEGLVKELGNGPKSGPVIYALFGDVHASVGARRSTRNLSVVSSAEPTSHGEQTSKLLRSSKPAKRRVG